MTLEEYVARLNGLAFWKEFTFSQNKFLPAVGSELELADNFVWLGGYAIALQLKSRDADSGDADQERSWFANKVVGKATKQVRDTVGYLDTHPEIRIVNERGHAFDVRGEEIEQLTKVVVFLPGASLPDDCLATRHHISKTAGFIHFFAAHDYLGVLEKLRVPEDIRRYFDYREQVLRDGPLPVGVEEPDIMAAFLTELERPVIGSREALTRLVQDFEDFDLSWLIGNLSEHIQNGENSNEYYRIMLEFAKVPRSVWREVKTRFTRSIKVLERGEFSRPFRLAYPDTSCSFMVGPIDPQLPVTGEEGEKVRRNGLKNLTYAAKYDMKTDKGIGVLISKDGEYFQIDWCLIDQPWEKDEVFEQELARSYPFRAASEKRVDGFLFRR